MFQATGAGAERPGAPSLAASDDNGSNQVVVCVTGDRTHALTSVGCGASEDGTGRGTPIVATFAELGEGHQSYRETDAAAGPETGSGGGSKVANLVAFHATQDPTSSEQAFPCRGTGSEHGSCTAGVVYPEPVRSITPDAIDRKGEANSGTLADRPGLGIIEGETQALRARRPNVIATRLVVRRLTPVECLRLQGLPDDWLDLDPPLSDSAKYRMIGNAGVTHNVEYILRRLHRVGRRSGRAKA